MTDEQKELTEVLLANRNYLYTLLHKAFGREPDEELLELLSEAGEAFGLLSGEDGDILSRCPRFFGDLKKNLGDPAFLEEVKDTYTRLFIGPDALTAPPWESVYRGEDAMLFQETTLRVRQFYRRFSLIPECYPRVADDSLALELDFMARLAQRALDAFQSEDFSGAAELLKGSKEFLEKHLLLWIPKFLERMQKAAEKPLYPQLCLVLDAFLKADRETLEEILPLLA